MRIKISPFAETDFDIAVEWYNSKRDVLGNEFAYEVSRMFERIKSNPLQFPKEYGKMRKAVIKRFPYSVFFVVKEDIAFVLGIFSASRNPNIMKNRYRNDR